MAARNGAAPATESTVGEGRKVSVGTRPSTPTNLQQQDGAKPGAAKRQSWRDVLPVHPACEMFPAMSPDELRALGEDIRAELHGAQRVADLIERIFNTLDIVLTQIEKNPEWMTALDLDNASGRLVLKASALHELSQREAAA
jgi:hypothetical protein